MNKLIDVVDFDIKSLTVHYRIKNGDADNFKIKMIDEKTNGYFYVENLYLEPNITYWSSCPFIKDYIYKNVKIIFEHGNKIIFEQSYSVYDKINENCLSHLYFSDYDVSICTYYEVFVLKTYEKHGISIDKNDIVVDIGANVGASIKLALDNKCKEIYCCEPNPICVNIIKKYYGANKNLYINQCAIANNSGISELILPTSDNTSGMAKILECVTPNQINNPQNFSMKVEKLTFKDFILKNNISKIDFLKVDCEGGEEFIFNELNIQYIKDNVSKIVIEYHNDKKEYINKLLTKVGFKTHVIPSSDVVGIIYAKK